MNYLKPHSYRSQNMRLRNELRQMLKRYEFDYFVTLASNHQQWSYAHLRSLLKQWDAQVNRQINGPKWVKRPDERLVWFAFLEKPDVNPHWHLMVSVDRFIETPARQDRTDRFPEIAEKHWMDLAPKGSFDCKTVVSSAINDYVTKQLHDEACFDNFTIFSQFLSK
ncbi:MAG: hypothetical protein VXY73_02445 [Pseudomonadota bacterium]|nr:hypothetical protein [Pseudomonadota bacterium]